MLVIVIVIVCALVQSCSSYVYGRNIAGDKRLLQTKHGKYEIISLQLAFTKL